MLRSTLFIALPLIALLPSCKSTECGPGTIERDSTCQPADETTGTAKCGPFTELQGDQCIPMFVPTVCDPATTSPDIDPATGVTTCIGTGTGGCSVAIACPAPAAGKQTICGQLYNLADNTKFAAAGATGAKCTTATSSGPCALQGAAYDAFAYAAAPSTTPPLATGSTYIDDCGRYRLQDITLPAGPFIALGFDDAGIPFGPAGVTNTTGVAVLASSAPPTNQVKNLEAWIVDKATTDLWESTNGPMLSQGIYVGIFRAHGCDLTTGVCTGDEFAPQAGVRIDLSGNPLATDDYYFQAELTHQHVDMAATTTSINGTALLTNASLGNGLNYGGTGGIIDTAHCQWEKHGAASLPNIVFLQVYRPTKLGLNTCTQ